MVTLQEIDEREEELNKVEAQAKTISRKAIPERKYGFGVTPQAQKVAIENRTQARNVLIQVQEQRQQ